ncbi:MAG: hypothetical protein H6705_17365 [Myxococcales bacterium]|nr:hypothetical protein [Myxococcales bacterium]
MSRLLVLAALVGGCVAIPEVDLPIPDAALDGARDAAPDRAIPDAAFTLRDAEPDGPPPECRAPADCPAPGVAEPRCDDGACAIGACIAGYVDLDGLAATGCEYRCARRDGPDDCDAIDGDCDGRVDEDAARCDCAARCQGPGAESICDGDTCRITTCAEGTYNPDGVTERGCPCDAMALTPAEAPFEAEPLPGDGARVHYPDDGGPGVVAWVATDDATRIYARAVDGEGHPLGLPELVADLDAAVELLAVRADGAGPLVAARTLGDDPVAQLLRGGRIVDSMDGCHDLRCLPARLPRDLLVARLDVEADARHVVRLSNGEAVAQWVADADDPAAELMAIACLGPARCLATIRRSQVRLVGAGFDRGVGEVDAAAIVAVDDVFIAALGSPGAVRVERLVRVGQARSVEVPLGRPDPVEAVRLVPEPDGGVTVFALAGEALRVRLDADLAVVDPPRPTPAGFIGEGRTDAGLYHDHQPRGLAGETFWFTALPHPLPAATPPLAAHPFLGLPIAVWYGADAIYAAAALPGPIRPVPVLTRAAPRTTAPAAAAIGDRFVVAEVMADRLRVASAGVDGIVERRAIPLTAPLDPAQSAAALLATAGPGVVVVLGARDGPDRFIGAARLDAPALAVDTPAERLEAAPALAGGPDGGLLATLADPGQGLRLLVRTVDGEGRLGPPVERARSFTPGHAIAHAPDSDGYLLAWLDRTRLACQNGAATAVRALALDPAGRPTAELRELPLAHDCPRAVRVAPAPGGGFHVAIAYEGDRASLIHLDPTGAPLAPPTPLTRFPGQDARLALTRNTAPMTLWTRPDRLLWLDHACGAP